MLTTQPNTFYLQRISFLVVLWALKRVRCQIDESVFLICRCFFSICSVFLFLVVLWAFAACALSNRRKCFLNLQVFFSICSAFLFLVVLWAFAACVVKLTKVFSYFAGVFFFIFAARFFFGLCFEHLQHVCCQIEEVVSLTWMCFLKLQRVELSRPPY